MPPDAGTGRATASCGSCGHVWEVAADADPKQCPECGWTGNITVGVVKKQVTKKRNF